MTNTGRILSALDKLREDIDIPISSSNFIKRIIEEDISSGKHTTIVTRFPPEPNGFLHLGHAKSICLNYGIAVQYNGKFNLRMDDTNPCSEEQRYIDSIEVDVSWLGAKWGTHKYYTSDYFDQLYIWAKKLIELGKAYVDHQTIEEIRKNRGDNDTPPKDSIYRNRSIEENMELFEGMKNGKFEEGECVLRAKIDMNHGNPNLRDPILYRILKQPHPHAGDKWSIYPMYDFAHGQSDSIEGITHSICTLEFELHRPLYIWFQEVLDIRRTEQIEFARLNITHTVLSKRKLLILVNDKHVNGWDDPRMPTISAVRRKGYPPQALWDFCDKIGVARRDQLIHIELLEDCVKDRLHLICPRRFACINPLKVVITNWNYNDDHLIEIEIPNHPDQSIDMGKRLIYFSKYLWIEKGDFWASNSEPPKDFKRLAKGRSIRLKYGFVITCNDVIYNEETGELLEIHCTYLENSHLIPSNVNNAQNNLFKRLAAIHWLSSKNTCEVEFRLYGRLFSVQDPGDQDKDWREYINRKSLVVRRGFAEKNILEYEIEYTKNSAIDAFEKPDRYQFERIGFFTRDVIDSTSTLPVYNLTIQLGESPDALIKTITETGAEQYMQESYRKTTYHKNREKIAAERAAKKTAKGVRGK
ncbi:glutaminyl-tRNA synthetase family protein [Cryptosporidium serpentis]